MQIAGQLLNQGGQWTFWIVPSLPGSGLKWDTGTLGADGMLRVAFSGIVNTNPPSLGYSISGDQLTLTWPSDHAGWRLQAQTNSGGTGIGTNWFEVSGSTNGNRQIITIQPGEGSVFYRLVYP